MRVSKVESILLGFVIVCACLVAIGQVLIMAEERHKLANADTDVRSIDEPSNGRAYMKGRLESAIARGYLGIKEDASVRWLRLVKADDEAFLAFAGKPMREAGAELDAFLRRHDDMPQTVKDAKADELAASLLRQVREAIREREGLQD